MSTRYENPLLTRYASDEMSEIWSPQRKHSLWRRLWVALAETQQELGLDISNEQVAELRDHVDDIDFDAAARHERELRHDVMAHVHAYRDQCPAAGGIIHLGATSCFVTDNAELIQIRDSLQLIRSRLVVAIDRLARFADANADLACLGYTHLQPAQPTTLGKRATLWCQDLALDLAEVEHRLSTLRFRGCKGTTGTQATFLQLFGGDHDKVQQLNRRVTEKMGFDSSYNVTGQTYPRKVDAMVLGVLSGVGQSLHKFGTDVRILAHDKELEEPFEAKQIGSSAMAYKRNPMRSERLCALARFVMSLEQNGVDTAATQWMERTLDDSANRRLSLPLAFLGTDACLILLADVARGMVAYPAVIASRLAAELPFMATEEILMAGVQAGGDRQELHEVIRVKSHEAGAEVKQHGRPNDLIERLRSEPSLQGVDLDSTLDAKRYIGRSVEQVAEFIAEVVDPIRKRYASDLSREDVGVSV